MAVNLRDDADTTGAVYGEIAEAYYRVGAILPEWRGRLSLSDEIMAMADRIFEHAQ